MENQFCECKCECDEPTTRIRRTYKPQRKRVGSSADNPSKWIDRCRRVIVSRERKGSSLWLCVTEQEIELTRFELSIYDLMCRRDEWTASQFTLKHNPTGTELWIANDRYRFEVYRPCPVKFTDDARDAMWLDCVNLLEYITTKNMRAKAKH